MSDPRAITCVSPQALGHSPKTAEPGRPIPPGSKVAVISGRLAYLPPSSPPPADALADEQVGAIYPALTGMPYSGALHIGGRDRIRSMADVVAVIDGVTSEMQRAGRDAQADRDALGDLRRDVEGLRRILGIPEPVKTTVQVTPQDPEALAEAIVAALARHATITSTDV